MKKVSLAFMAIAGISLSACATNQTMINPSKGKAVLDAANAHIVDKNAVPGAPVQHPDKAAAAIDRYLDDQVKQSESQSGVGFGDGG